MRRAFPRSTSDITCGLVSFEQAYYPEVLRRVMTNSGAKASSTKVEVVVHIWIPITPARLSKVESHPVKPSIVVVVES